MKAHRLGITVVAIVTLTGALGAGVAPASKTPSWLEALKARSAALNEQHGLGVATKRLTLGTPGPGWLEALEARGAAMNRHYGLGAYARQSAARSAAPDWLTSLNARSDALNREYGLGAYARRTGG